METLKAKKKNGQMDFLLYVTVLLLCAFGLVMVFSASYYYAQNKASLNYDGLYYLKNQAKYMAMGLGVMIVMSRVDYHYLEKLRNVGLMVTLLLMLATVFWGEDINGAKRWLNLFDVITFQPSELAKFVLILYMASFMTRRAPQMKSFTRGIVPMLIIMCIICILLLLQKNMSMMMVVMMIGFVMLFLGGADMRHLVGLCLLAVPVVLFGNRNFDDALMELSKLLTGNGFACVAGGAFVGEHSFSRTLGAGRPNGEDEAEMDAFADSVAAKLAAGDTAPVTVGGCDPIRPYYTPRDRHGNPINILKVKPKTDMTKCSGCGLCAARCPMGSIDAADVSQVNGICIKCCACVKGCPAGAKYFDDPGYLYHKSELEEIYGRPAKNEVFL